MYPKLTVLFLILALNFVTGCVSGPITLIDVVKTSNYTIYIYEEDNYIVTAKYFNKQGELVKTEQIN